MLFSCAKRKMFPYLLMLLIVARSAHGAVEIKGRAHLSDNKKTMDLHLELTEATLQLAGARGNPSSGAALIKGLSESEVPRTSSLAAKSPEGNMNSASTAISEDGEVLGHFPQETHHNKAKGISTSIGIMMPKIQHGWHRIHDKLYTPKIQENEQPNWILVDQPNIQTAKPGEVLLEQNPAQKASQFGDIFELEKDHGSLKNRLPERVPNSGVLTQYGNQLDDEEVLEEFDGPEEEEHRFLKDEEPAIQEDDSNDKNDNLENMVDFQDTSKRHKIKARSREESRKRVI